MDDTPGGIVTFGVLNAESEARKISFMPCSSSLGFDGLLGRLGGLSISLSYDVFFGDLSRSFSSFFLRSRLKKTRKKQQSRRSRPSKTPKRIQSQSNGSLYDSGVFTPTAVVELTVGERVGNVVGACEGDFDGEVEGDALGVALGDAEGDFEGRDVVGDRDGDLLGD